jgi:hypothetical protein
MVVLDMMQTALFIRYHLPKRTILLITFFKRPEQNYVYAKNCFACSLVCIRFLYSLVYTHIFLNIIFVKKSSNIFREI